MARDRMIHHVFKTMAFREVEKLESVMNLSLQLVFTLYLRQNICYDVIESGGRLNLHDKVVLVQTEVECQVQRTTVICDTMCANTVKLDYVVCCFRK
jgi:hypothetical protein